MTVEEAAARPGPGGLPGPARVLAVGAHPDDVEFGCGGTVAKWAAQGARIRHLICTDGSKGSWDPDRDPVALAATRQAEQRAAADRLGGTGAEVVFLGWPDGELTAGVRLRTRIAREIRRFRPTVLLGHDPWKLYQLQADHRAAGQLLTDALMEAQDGVYLPELDLPPHRAAVLLLWEAEQPDHAEDIGDFVEVKIAALLEHRSQYRNSLGITEPTPAELAAFADRIRRRTAEYAQGTAYRHAERFKLIELFGPYSG